MPPKKGVKKPKVKAEGAEGEDKKKKRKKGKDKSGETCASFLYLLYILLLFGVFSSAQMSAGMVSVNMLSLHAGGSSTSTKVRTWNLRRSPRFLGSLARIHHCHLKLMPAMWYVCSAEAGTPRHHHLLQGHEHPQQLHPGAAHDIQKHAVLPPPPPLVEAYHSSSCMLS